MLPRKLQRLTDAAENSDSRMYNHPNLTTCVSVPSADRVLVYWRIIFSSLGICLVITFSVLMKR